MKCKIQMLHEGAKMPLRKTDGAVGYDLYTPQDWLVPEGRSVIPMGFALEIEPLYEGKIDARSGFNLKGFEGYKPIVNSNHNGNRYDIANYHKGEKKRFDCDVLEGNVDWDYRNEVGVIVNNHDQPFIIEAGTRIAQLKFYRVETPVLEVAEQLSKTDRKGGYNSTGTK